MALKKIFYFLLSVAAGLLLLLPWPAPVLSSIAFIISVTAQSLLLGTSLFPHTALYFRGLLGLLTLASFIAIAGGLAFYFFNLTAPVLCLITLLVPLLTLLPSSRRAFAALLQETLERSWSQHAPLG